MYGAKPQFPQAAWNGVLIKHTCKFICSLPSDDTASSRRTISVCLHEVMSPTRQGTSCVLLYDAVNIWMIRRES
jgi:hypothetical protein